MTTKPIGIFDSGVGGLSVLAELQKLMPNEHFIYFGDSANVPYGDKSKAELVGFSKNILDWFKSKEVKMVIMACNTSSAVTLPHFKDKYNFDVLGLIDPISKHISTQDYSKIGMIATNATVKSNAYKNTIQKYCDKKVFQMACPGLVELVEKDKIDSPKATPLVYQYIEPLINSKVDKIILGCTHYPFLSTIINNIVGKDILLNPAEFLAKETFNIVEKSSANKGKVDFHTSKSPEEFVSVGKKLYPYIKNAKLLELNL